MTTTLLAAEGELNPLVPHPVEIVVGTIAFLLLFWLLAKTVFPQFEKVYAERTDKIEGGLKRAEEAQEQAAALKRQYEEQLAGLRAEAARIRDDARAEGHADPGRAAGAGRAGGRAHPPARRGAAGRAARAGRAPAPRRDRRAVGAAGRAHHRRRRSPTTAAARATVDAFLAELDGHAPTAGRSAPGRRGRGELMALVLQAASRESLAASAPGSTCSSSRSARPPTCDRLGDELFAVAAAARRASRAAPAPGRPGRRRGGARRAWPSGCSAASSDRPALDAVAERLVAARWSRPVDLVERARVAGPQRGARRRPRRSGTPRRGRGRAVPLRPHPRPRARAGRAAGRHAHARPTGGSRCSTGVLGGKVTPVTATLLRQAVRAARAAATSTSCAEELAELAAARRERSVARVTTPVRAVGRAGAAAHRRADPALRPADLAAGRAGPALLGGLVVRVGGEVIDGSVAGRLAAARRTLPQLTAPRTSTTNTRRNDDSHDRADDLLGGDPECDLQLRLVAGDRDLPRGGRHRHRHRRRHRPRRGPALGDDQRAARVRRRRARASR